MKIRHATHYGKSLILAVATFALILINFILDWPLVKLSGIRAKLNFADLLSTTSTIDCYREISFEVYSSSNVGYCGNYIYGRELLQIISKLPIYPSQLNILGIIAVLLFSTVAAIFTLSIKKPSLSTTLFTILLIASPGTSLLLERGNIDVFIIIGVFLVAYLISRDRVYSGYIILSLLTIFKFYTLPLFALIIFLESRRRQKLVGFLLILPATALSIQSILSVQAGFPEGGHAQFGLNIIGNYLRRGLNLEISHLEGRIIGYATFILLLIGLSYIVKSRLAIQALMINKSDISLFGFYSGVVFLTCYVTGLSYDYRLPFLIFSSLWILNATKLPPKFQVILRTLTVFASWFSTGLGAYFFTDNTLWQRYVVMGTQGIGDLAIWVLAGFFCIVALENSKKEIRLFAPSFQKFKSDSI